MASNHHSSGEIMVDVQQFTLKILRFLPIIAGGSIAGLLIGYFAAQYFAPKTYESRALVEVLSQPTQKILNPLKDSNGLTFGAVSKTAMQYINTYAFYPVVMKRVHESLTEAGCNISALTFHTADILSTPMVGFHVRSNSAQCLQTAADLWTQETLAEVASFYKQQFEQGHSLMKERYENIKNTASKLEKRIQTIKPNIELKTSQIEQKKQLLLKDQAEIEQASALLESSKINLPVYQEEIKKHEKFLRAHVDSKSEKSDGDYKYKLLNPLYAELDTKITEARINIQTQQAKKEKLEKHASQVSKELHTLQAALNEESVELQTLQRDLRIVNSEYEILYTKVAEANIARALPITELRLVAPAGNIETKIPVKRYMAWGFLLGFCITLSAYWLLRQKTAETVLAKPSPLAQPDHPLRVF